MTLQLPIVTSAIVLFLTVQLIGCTKTQAPQAETPPPSTPNLSEQAAKPAPPLCSDHQHCAPLRESEKKCREGKKEADCKSFVEHFEKLSVKTDCQRSFDTEPVPSVWLCDMDAEEVEFPKLHERSAATLSKLKFKFAKKFYGSEAFRSTLDGALAEDHRADSEKASQETSK